MHTITQYELLVTNKIVHSLCAKLKHNQTFMNDIVRTRRHALGRPWGVAPGLLVEWAGRTQSGARALSAASGCYVLAQGPQCTTCVCTMRGSLHHPKT